MYDCDIAENGTASPGDAWCVTHNSPVNGGDICASMREHQFHTSTQWGIR